ncbi:MAG TPA: hypothetical protein VFQ22_11890, partial [Longimicrobiales bacterium]|nr:hypothetical protein [Longimicrobiales bacterium]
MTPAPPQTKRGGIRRLAGQLLLAGLVLVAVRAVPWEGAAEAVARASPAGVVLATLAHLLILPLGAWQWMQLLPAGDRVPLRDLLWIRSVGWAVANGGPFLAEHAASVHLLARRGGLG